MRHFILILSFVLMSATAYAGPSRDFASNELIDQVQPAEKAADPQPRSDTKPRTERKQEDSAPTRKTARTSRVIGKPAIYGRRGRNYDYDEERARGIASRYGFSW